MALELVYTSSPKGLRLGASGFCTVACTRGMAANYVDVLESLSGYAPVFPPQHPQAALNPVAWSHHRYVIGGHAVSILSRVAFAGTDYTQRTNKLAYHLVLDPSERAVGGPAWMMQQPRLMWEEWIGEPRYLEHPRQVPKGDASVAPCSTWERLLGDGGWAAVLAQAFMDEPEKPAFLLFEPGMPSLDLVAEALRLVPAERRWGVTFNTYFNALPMGTSCVWRFCLKDSPALKQARRTPGTLVIDLTARGGQSPGALERMLRGTPLLEMARTGVARKMAAPAAAVSPPPGLQLQEAFSLAHLPPRMSLPPNLRPPCPENDSGEATRGFSSSPARKALAIMLAGILLAMLIGGIIWFFMGRQTRREAAAASGGTSASSTTTVYSSTTTVSSSTTTVYSSTTTVSSSTTTTTTLRATSAPVAWTWFDVTETKWKEALNRLTKDDECRISIAGLPEGARIESMGWWGEPLDFKKNKEKVRWNADTGEFESTGKMDDTTFAGFLKVNTRAGYLDMKAAGVSPQIDIATLDLPQMAFLQLHHGDKQYAIFLQKRVEVDKVPLSWNKNTKKFAGEKSIQNIMTDSAKVMPHMKAGDVLQGDVRQKDNQFKLDAKLDGYMLKVTLEPKSGKPDCGAKCEGRVALLITVNGKPVPIATFDLILAEDAPSK